MPQITQNPTIPYLAPFEEDYGPGKMIRIQGTTPPKCDRFNINLQCGPNIEPRDDIALHCSVRVSEGYIARNTLDKQQWGQEEGQGYMPIGPGQQFEILILCEHQGFKIAVNGKHFCDYTHRVASHRVTHLAIDGEVAVGMIIHEIVPVLPPGVNQPAPGAPPPMQGPPMQGPPMQGPPMYGPPSGPGPQQYGPGPQQYGPGPQQYGPQGPPPPEENKQSGLESFLGEAGIAVATAIGQQAIQRLAGGNANKPGQQSNQQPVGGGYGDQNVAGTENLGTIIANIIREATSKADKSGQQFPPGQFSGGLNNQPPASSENLGAILANIINEAINKGNNKPGWHPPSQPVSGGYGNQSAGGTDNLGSILSQIITDATDKGNKPGQPVSGGLPHQPVTGAPGNVPPAGGTDNLASVLNNIITEAANKANKPGQQTTYRPVSSGPTDRPATDPDDLGSILSSYITDKANKQNQPQAQGSYPYPQGGQDAGLGGAIGSILGGVLADSTKPNNPPPPQHPQYGPAPQGQDPGLGGAIGSILGNVLSEATQGNKNQPPPPQPPPQQGYGRPAQGGNDLGNLFGSFASSFFSPQRK